MRSPRCALVVALACSMAAPAGAQGKTKDDRPRREGEYQGVKPGHSEFKPRKSRRPRVTWIGYQSKADGASRFFVQVNKSVELDQYLDDKGVLHVTLIGAVVGSRQVVRRIDTRFFDTAVAAVKARRVRRSRARKGRPAQAAGVRLDFRFKTPADAQRAQADVRKEEDGYHYVYLGFAPAKERPEADAPKDDGPTGSDDVAP